MKLQSIITFIAALFLVNISLAQTGTVKGTVVEMVNNANQAVPFANVSLAGTTMGGTTDFDGNFEFTANPGTYQLVVSFTGYISDTSQVVVTEGETTTTTVTLGKNVQQLKAAVVIGKVNRESENALIMDQKNSSSIQQSMGAGALANKGATDIGSGVAKMSGVSKSSSRGVYVRGLGDRYNNVYLNGMPLPSPDPNKKVIDLSLIPTAVVRNIDVYKTFSVDQFGDMSGASLDINTKDAPEDPFLKFSAGVNFNTNTTFQDFKNSRNGDIDYLGLSGNGREEPELVSNEFGVLGLPADNNEDPFNTGLDYDEYSAPIDHSYSIQGGKTIELNEDDKLGFVASLSYRNRNRRDEGRNNVLDANQVSSKNFLRERFSNTTNLTTLMGAEYNKGDKHILNFNYLFINNSKNDYITSHGNNDEQDDWSLQDIHNVRDRYVQQRLHDFQLRGQHEFGSQFDFNWGGSFAIAKTDEPDRKDLSFITPKNNYDEGILSTSTGGVNQRYFQYTNENEIYGYGEGVYKFGIPHDEESDSKHKLVAGIQTKLKNRDVEFRAFQYNLPQGSSLINSTFDLSNLDNSLNDQAYANQEYRYSVVYSGSNLSEAYRYVHSGYVYGDFDVTEKLKLVPGIRAEYTDQVVSYRLEGAALNSDFEEEEVSEVDLMPSLSGRYTLNDLNALRFAASKTLTRPNFQELIPIGFQNENLQSITGNPALQNSEVYNLDLKFERINKRGEMAAFGAFYKYIDNPIEQVASGVNFISYFNMDYANVVGLEFDYNVRLGSLLGDSESPFVKGVYFDGNLTYMYTSVSTEDLDEATAKKLSNVTESDRQLQGASPYLVNFSVGFDKPIFESSRRSNISVSYNHFGDRIFTAGTQDRGDEYELGYGTLNLVMQNTWKNGFGVKVAVKNMLNPEIKREQKSGPETTVGDAITQSYTRGVNFGLSLTYTFLNAE